jgi:cytochrome c peroxidase
MLGEGRGLSSRPTQDVVRDLEIGQPSNSYLAGNQAALPQAATAGLEKFINTGCVACHNGVGMYQKFGVVEEYWRATGSDPIDKGRFDVTKGT